MLATPVQAADGPLVVRAQPQNFDSGSNQVSLLEIFQTEVDNEIVWPAIVLGRIDTDESIAAIAWHISWRRATRWLDPFARHFSDRRQRQLIRNNPWGTEFTPQAFLNGQEWRGLLQGTKPKTPNPQDVGVLKAKLFETAAFNLTFEPGPDFKHNLNDLTAHMVRLVRSENRKIPGGPAEGVFYQASHSVIDYQLGRWDEERQHWRFTQSVEQIWPEDEPPARLVFWIESQKSHRPVQVLQAQVEVRVPPLPAIE